MKKEITILIVEDKEISKEIISKYFDKNKVTYANILPASKRKEVVELIEKIEDN